MAAPEADLVVVPGGQDGWTSSKRARASPGSGLTRRSRPAVAISAHLPARATGLSEREWRRASGPHLRKMLATGRFPTLSRAVHDGAEADAEVAFATGLGRVLDAVAAKLTGPSA
ncbi:TetR/AcrR family transcriptional regulator C-terminal domain-containing protein [Spirillospora sp. NPDC127200]